METENTNDVAARTTAKRGRPIQNIALCPNGLRLTDDGIAFDFTVTGPKGVEGRTAILNLTMVEVGEMLLKIQAGVEIAAQLQALENWSA